MVSTHRHLTEQMTLYEISTSSGNIVTFETDLTPEEAFEIVKNLPTSKFNSWILRGEVKTEKQRLWALKVAQDYLESPQEGVKGPYIDFVRKIESMQKRSATRVILRFEGLTVKAVTTGKNTGSIYLHRGDKLVGWLSSDGYFRGDGIARKVLDRISADPEGEAREYGRKTGRCSYCGKTLSDPRSRHEGIGPICLERSFAKGVSNFSGKILASSNSRR